MNIQTKLPTKGVIAVVGTQWGDEGKGKIVDLFAEWADVVARGTGGANAGHTIVVNGQSHIFHLVPSAILRDGQGVTNVIGRGVAFDPKIMLEELRHLDSLGVTYQRMRISREARIVLPQHIARDRLREAAAGQGKLGTTGRGIGPTYSDHVARCGLRVVDLLNPVSFQTKLKRNLAFRKTDLLTKIRASQTEIDNDEYLSRYFAGGTIDVDQIVADYTAFGKKLRRFIIDTDELLRKAVTAGKRVLLEGAQAALLSIEYGIYPKVTSSDSTIGGLIQGVGLPSSTNMEVFGVVKAPYMTRVGSGVFPTELGSDEVKDTAFKNANINSSDPAEQCVAIRRAGNEYGATTARPRRPGWLDLPLLRLALKHGGSRLILTKTDVMDTCREIRICTHYLYKGPDYDLGDKVLSFGNMVSVAYGDDELMQHMEPQYRVFPGWCQPICDIRDPSDLPSPLNYIIRFIEDSVDCEVAIVSVGPDREQTIWLD